MTEQKQIQTNGAVPTTPYEMPPLATPRLDEMIQQKENRSKQDAPSRNGENEKPQNGAVPPIAQNGKPPPKESPPPPPPPPPPQESKKTELKSNAAKGEEAQKKIEDVVTADSSNKLSDAERKEIIDAEKLFQEGLTSIRDFIAPSSMELEYSDIKVSGMYAKSFFVYTYPRFIEANWLSPIINFDVTMDIAQFIYPIDSAAIMKVLKRKVAQMQSSMPMAAEKGTVRDPGLET